MQVCVERVPVGSLVVGVDLDPIRPVRGAVSLQEDITDPKCRAAVKRVMAENGCQAFDLVLHDGSPNVGGAWAKEATSQNALVIDSVKLATELLAPKGNFVTKVHIIWNFLLKIAGELIGLLCFEFTIDWCLYVDLQEAVDKLFCLFFFGCSNTDYYYFYLF